MQACNSSGITFAVYYLVSDRRADKAPSRCYGEKTMTRNKITTSEAADKNNYRLPRTVLPRRYEIAITPDLETFRFFGTETIDVEVVEPVSQIVLNAKNLRISKAKVYNSDGTSLTGSVTLERATEMARIAFAGVLGKGNWRLQLSFKGIHNDKLRGFYRVAWKNKEDKQHWFVSTQFESTDARQAFPCFDEPDMKAVFSVKLVVDRHLTALSNGQVVKETPIVVPVRRGGKTLQVEKKLVEYTDTIPMSTYLVAFVVGEFVSSRPVYVDGIETRIWTLPGQEHLTEFALEQACKATAFLNRETQMRYPGKHINHVAIRNFASGAMENWGLITYRETALLCDLATATHKEKKRVAEVIWHELAHNIHFGNTVTMKWWNGLCLNESFATFAENWGVSQEYPDWHIWEEFAISRAAAMKLDSLMSTHPVEVPVNRPEEAEELFDLISYEKGCSLLYQLQQFIGPDAFRNGVARYIKKFAFGNAETHDLWDTIEQVCRESGNDTPVRRLMDAWNFTAGHPVVSVRSAGDGFVDLSQSAFKFLPGDSRETWPIPVTMKIKQADGSMITRKFLLEGKEHREFVGSNYQYVVVNAGGSGFYRVLYAPELSARLTANLQENLSTVERYNLVNDSWCCVQSGLYSAPEYLRLVGMFGNEKDPNIWSLVIESLAALKHLLPAGDGRNQLEVVARSLIAPAFAAVGLEPKAGESLQQRQLRGLLLSALGTVAGDSKTQQLADELYSKYKQDSASLDSEIVAAVVRIVAHAGDKADHDEFTALFKGAKNPQVEQRCLSALARFQDEELAKRSLEMALDGSVRTQDAPYLVAEIMRNPAVAIHAWEFMKKNWAQMVKSYPDNGIVRMCGSVVALNYPELLDDVKKFFAKRKVKGGAMALSQALEQLHVNVLMRQRESERLAAHLSPSVKTA